MNNTDKLAHIAINKSLLKEFRNSENERIVYLKDGDEFQIQIFNPYQYIIGVSFSFNSDNIDNSKLLVLKPGERVWLERYIDSSNKFIFSTYEVGTSKEVKKAIEKNGILNVYFYKEQEKNNNIWISSISNGSIQPYTYPDWKDNIIYCDNISSSISTSTATSAYYNDSNSTLTPTSAATYTSITTNSDSNIKYGTNSCINQNNVNRSLNKKSIETGRIDKGSYSNQNFNNYYGDFQNWYFKQETIKLLPQSQKQINTNDLKKKYCHNCGKKIKSDFKFCPNCGAKQ